MYEPYQYTRSAARHKLKPTASIKNESSERCLRFSNAKVALIMFLFRYTIYETKTGTTTMWVTDSLYNASLTKIEMSCQYTIRIINRIMTAEKTRLEFFFNSEEVLRNTLDISQYFRRC